VDLPKPRVYVETTIPSFYHDLRPEAAIVERRHWTRVWWSRAAEKYELITSSTVLAELAAGTSSRVPLRMKLLTGLPVLFPDAAVVAIVQEYIRHKLMPSKPPEDALHLALASYHRCDFIVTWNCKHLANANKFTHLRSINQSLGLYVPRLVTPKELVEGEE
jgi:predicted nucleic acid-binding protein